MSNLSGQSRHLNRDSFGFRVVLKETMPFVTVRGSVQSTKKTFFIWGFFCGSLTALLWYLLNFFNRFRLHLLVP